MRDFFANIRAEFGTLMSTRTFYFLLGILVAKGNVADILGALKDFAGF